MSESTDSCKNAKLELIKLIAENPELPIRLCVNVDNNPEDYSYLLLQFTSAKIANLYIHKADS